jgi:hypothetical protein
MKDYDAVLRHGMVSAHLLSKQLRIQSIANHSFVKHRNILA